MSKQALKSPYRDEKGKLHKANVVPKMKRNNFRRKLKGMFSRGLRRLISRKKYHNGCPKDYHAYDSRYNHKNTVTK